MKKSVIGLSLGAVLVIALAAAGVAFAQDWVNTGRGPNGPVEGQECPLHELMETALADALGISTEEFEARRDAGESFFDIALSLGFDIDEARQLMISARETAIQQAMEQGLIDEGWAEGMPHMYGLRGGGDDRDCPHAQAGMGSGRYGGMMGAGSGIRRGMMLRD